jgi:hypothetical protein
MTEKRTLALNTRQWRVLLHDNLDLLKAAVQQTEALNEDGLKNFYAQLDDMRMLATAWFQVSAPKEPEVKAADVPAQTNGVSAPKKRRGRPSNAEIAARAQVQ